MTTASCRPAPIPLVRSAPQRWLAGLQNAWATWRQQVERQAEWRALEDLGESTRRDLGLAERAPPSPNRALWDHERGIW